MLIHTSDYYGVSQIYMSDTRLELSEAGTNIEPVKPSSGGTTIQHEHPNYWEYQTTQAIKYGYYCPICPHDLALVVLGHNINAHSHNNIIARQTGHGHACNGRTRLPLMLVLCKI